MCQAKEFIESKEIFGQIFLIPGKGIALRKRRNFPHVLLISRISPNLIVKVDLGPRF